MPEVFHQTFEDLGTSVEEKKLRFLKCEPNYRVWYADGDYLEFSTDLAKMKRRIEAREGVGSLHALLSFLRESGKHYDLSMTHVLSKDFPHLSNMLRPSLIMSLLPLHFLRARTVASDAISNRTSCGGHSHLPACTLE